MICAVFYNYLSVEVVIIISGIIRPVRTMQKWNRLAPSTESSELKRFKPLANFVRTTYQMRAIPKGNIPNLTVPREIFAESATIAL